MAASAQNDFCYVSITPNANQEISVDDFVPTTMKIKVYFHIYRNSEDMLGPNQQLIESTMASLNSGGFSFDDLDLSFFYNDCETRWVNDDEYYNNSTCLEMFFDKYRHLDGIDIHLKDDLGDHGSLAAAIISDEFVLGGNKQEFSNGINLTAMHEMGHCFGLFHTQHGHCPVVNLDCNGNVFFIETNCVDGDFVQDTNPDPHGAADQDCVFIQDPNLYCNATGETNSCSQFVDLTDPPISNIMSSYTNCKSNFTAHQLIRMSVFAPDQVRHAENEGCCYDQDYDWVIDEDKDFDFEQNIGGDLYITDGATLTISENTYFYDNKYIFIENGSKLIITEGVTLGPCDDSFRWGGIRVRGTGQVDDQSGLFASNAIIKGAKTGVSQNYGSFGGFMDLQNVTFQDCKRGIELMRYSGEENVQINNCTFSNGQYGITSWANDFEILNCAFDNISEAAIRGFDSSPTIDGGNLGYPNFVDCKDGIRLAFPSGQSSSTEISDNYFYDNRRDIHVISGVGITGEGRTIVEHNTFESSAVGVYIDAANTYTIRNNDFYTSGIDNYTRAAGGSENFIIENEYAGSALGAAYTVENDFTQFSQNCYSNHSFSDAYVSGLFTNQGSPQIANGNCFSLTNPEIRTSSTSVAFDYFVLNNINESDCRAVTSNGNYGILESASSEEFGNCGSSFAVVHQSDDLSHPCNPGRNEVDVRDAIADIVEIIANLENSTQLSHEDRENLIEFYRNCLRKVTLYLVDILITENRVQEAILTLRTYDEFQMQIKGYFIYTSRNENFAAKSYLENLTPSNSEEIDFVNSQLIYVESLQDENYVPKPIDLESIYDAGNENTVLAGFSRSIYLYFTEELIDLDIDVEDFDAQPRRNEMQGAKIEITVYPNPVSNDPITISGLDANGKNNYMIIVRSILDEIIAIKKINGLEKVQLEGFEAKGLFILSIFKNGKQIHTEKLVKI